MFEAMLWRSRYRPWVVLFTYQCHAHCTLYNTPGICGDRVGIRQFRLTNLKLLAPHLGLSYLKQVKIFIKYSVIHTIREYLTQYFSCLRCGAAVG